MKTDRLQIRNKFIKEENKPYIMPNNDDHNYTSDYVKWLEDKVVNNINYTRCCETSIADFQIGDKITFKQHRSGTVTDVYINELQVKDVSGNYKTIGRNDVIEKY